MILQSDFAKQLCVATTLVSQGKEREERMSTKSQEDVSAVQFLFSLNEPQPLRPLNRRHMVFKAAFLLAWTGGLHVACCVTQQTVRGHVGMGQPCFRDGLTIMWYGWSWANTSAHATTPHTVLLWSDTLWTWNPYSSILIKPKHASSYLLSTQR